MSEYAECACGQTHFEGSRAYEQHIVRGRIGRVRPTRPGIREEARIADRLQRMAAGYFG